MEVAAWVASGMVVVVIDWVAVVVVLVVVVVAGTVVLGCGCVELKVVDLVV